MRLASIAPCTPEEDPGYWQWVKIILALFIIGSVVFSIGPIRNSIKRPDKNKDYTRWHYTGEKVIAGEPLYDATDKTEAFYYIYPPFPAVMFYAPASFLGPIGVAIVVTLTSAISWGIVIVLSVYQVTGRWLHKELMLYLVPCIITAPYVFDNFLNGQPNILLLALLMLGLHMMEKGRGAMCGTLIGIAAAFKAFPILILPYLVWRKAWSATLVAIVSFVVCSAILPGAFRGFERNANELYQWFDGMILKQSGDNVAQRPGRAYRMENQSLMASIHRLTRPAIAGQVGEDETKTFYVNLMDIGTRGSNVVFLIATIGLCGAFIAYRPRSGERNQCVNGIEHAMVLILVLIITPKVSPYYFFWLYPGLVALLAFFYQAPPESADRKRYLYALIGVVALLACAISKLWHGTIQAYGMTTWGALLLYSMLCLLMVRARKSLDETSDSGPPHESPTAS